MTLETRLVLESSHFVTLETRLVLDSTPPVPTLGSARLDLITNFRPARKPLMLVHHKMYRACSYGLQLIPRFLHNSRSLSLHVFQQICNFIVYRTYSLKDALWCITYDHWLPDLSEFPSILSNSPVNGALACRQIACCKSGRHLHVPFKALPCKVPPCAAERRIRA